MPTAREDLLDRVVRDVAVHGLRDRSLRRLAESIGTSHRMLLYHFGSRDGLVAAVVDAVEAAQRELLGELATAGGDPVDVARAMWARVASPELRPFVRLFFESLAYVADRPPADRLTRPWLDVAATAAAEVGADLDEVDLRLAVAVTRGLLVDVLATGEVEPATAALERFLARWAPGPG